MGMARQQPKGVDNPDDFPPDRNYDNYLAVIKTSKQTQPCFYIHKLANSKSFESKLKIYVFVRLGLIKSKKNLKCEDTKESRSIKVVQKLTNRVEYTLIHKQFINFHDNIIRQYPILNIFFIFRATYHIESIF